MYFHWLYGNLKSCPLGDKWGGPTSNESLTQVTPSGVIGVTLRTLTENHVWSGAIEFAILQKKPWSF